MKYRFGAAALGLDLGKGGPVAEVLLEDVGKVYGEDVVAAKEMSLG